MPALFALRTTSLAVLQLKREPRLVAEVSGAITHALLLIVNVQATPRSVSDLHLQP